MHHLPRIQATVKKLFRRLSGAKRRDIAANLCMLAAGRKPCVFWDFCAFQADSVGALCSECLEGEAGVIFNLEEDYFLCKKTDLIRHLGSALDNPPVFINIAGHRPTMCSSDTVMLILDWVRNLLRAVEASLLAFQTGQKEYQDSVPILTLVSRPEWNLSTLFGVLLGYPVVYWFPKLQDQNCLSNEDLKVYSVELDGSTVISFSVPHTMVLQQQNSLQHSVEEPSSLQTCIDLKVCLSGPQCSVSNPNSVVPDSSKQRENSSDNLKGIIDGWARSVFPELVFNRPGWNRSFVLGDLRLDFGSKIVNQPFVVL